MSEPVIPERWEPQYAACKKQDQRLEIGARIIEELGSAEEELRECRQIQAYLRADKVIAAAKIAELEHDVSEWSSAALDYQRQIKEQAAIIERLTNERDFADALLKGKTVTKGEIDAALGKEEPK